MVREVKDKYSFWLAGYYDDFTNARGIADDENTPSFTVPYSSLKSHHGNPLNGEATSNPRYRWSIIDREEYSTTLNSINGVSMDLLSKLKNNGMYEWLTHDTIRNSNSNWAGRAQLQYPNGLAPNRFKYGDGTSNTDYKDTGLGSNNGYQLIVNGYDTNGIYLLNCGNEDATFRRSAMEPYHTKTDGSTDNITSTEYVNKKAGMFDSWYTSSEPNRNIAMSHLTGIWAGECLSYTTGSATNATPENLFKTLKSPGGKPFLVIKGINNTDAIPSISYDGALNSRLDNDVFHVRLAARCHHGDTTSTNSNIRGQSFTNGEYPMLIDFKVGYPVSQAGISDTTAYSGNPAINFRLGLGTSSGNLGGNYAHYSTYDCLGASHIGGFQSNVNADWLDHTWIDVDFRIDYTNQKYYVYIDGTQIGNTSGYSLDNTAFGSSVTADELYGYELYHRPETTNASTSTVGVAYLMLDRVGLVRYLTSPLTNKDRHAETPVTNFKLSMPNNAFSSGTIDIFDPADDGQPGTSASNYTYNLKDLFSNTDPVDCDLIVFASEEDKRIDRPVWRGVIENMRINQHNKDRKITITANHRASLLGKQIPLWDVGQLGNTENEDPVPYWTAENNGFQSIMNMGTRPLKLLDHKLGFGKKNNFQQNANQRLQLGSGMPIQMYNNEDAHGPNSIENEYFGFSIAGFQQRKVFDSNFALRTGGVASLTTNTNDALRTCLHMDGFPELTTSSANINIVNSGSHNLTNVDILHVQDLFDPAESRKVITDATYTPETSAHIIYMGSFRTNDLTSAHIMDISGIIGVDSSVWWNNYLSNYYNTSAANTSIGVSQGNTVSVVFDANPGLEVGDTFYINNVNKGKVMNNGFGATNASPCHLRLCRKATVTEVRVGKDIYTTNRTGTTHSATPNIYSVITDIPMDTNSWWEGRYGKIRNGELTLTGNNRYEWSKDSGQLNLRDGDLAEAYYRPIHARWMRDLPKSLWFKYHYGVIDYYPYGLDPNSGPFGSPGVFAEELSSGRFTGTGNVLENTANFTIANHPLTTQGNATYGIGPTTKAVPITASLYNKLVAQQQWSGVCQLEARGFWTNNSNLDGTGTGPQKYTDAGSQPNTSGKFIYQGLEEVSGSYYMTGCKYIGEEFTWFGSKTKKWKDGNNYTYSNQVWVFPLQFKEDYKHLWILWADMRIDGNADADGGTRKTKFGLQVPATEKYKVNLYYLDKLKADGSPDKFTELKINEDLVLSEISSIDPCTNAGFSKPVNYGNGTATTAKTVSSLAANSATFGSYAQDRLKITSNSHGITTTHVHISNSNSHDGVYKVLDTNTNQILVDTAFVEVDTGALGGISVRPCAISSDTRFQDWEDKGGAMCIIDTSPFFNLNTPLNQGGVYQIGGGNTNLTDYEVETTGFPALLDNYWAEAIASDGNKGKNQATNPNAYKVISDVTSLTHDVNIDDAGLRVADINIFADSGVGRMQMSENVEGSNDVNIFTLYFIWTSKNTTERTSDDAWNGATLVNNNTNYKLQLTTFDGSATNWEELGIEPGMMIINDTTGVKHKIIEVGDGNTGQSGYDVDELIINRGVTGSATWSVNDDWTIPVQLGGLWTHSNPLWEEASGDTIDNRLANLRYLHTLTGGYVGSQNAVSVKDGTDGDGDYDWETVTVSSTIWTGANIITRMIMHLEGVVEAENIGTYADSDKVRTLWNAGLTKNWNPRTRLASLYDINNIPNTNLMTSDGGTTNNDLYGGVLNIGTGNLLSSLKNIQRSAGFGTINNHHTSFSWLSGRDSRIELRPKYNSGMVFDRNNMKVNSLKTNVSGVVTNVRVYYNDNKNFVDYPKGTISSTTRWKTLEFPTIKLEKEAYRLAQKEYNASRKTNAVIDIEPIDTAYVEDSATSLIDSKLIQTGRYGYIADPYIALQGKADTSIKPHSWTRLGTGGSLFTGMSNALDGNLGTNGTAFNRWGKSGYSQANTSATDIAWNNNFYWYGSHSVSHAVQVVHVPNHCPLVSEETGHELRVFVTPKENQTNATQIDDAEFCIWVVDYAFGASSGKVKAADISDSGGTHSMTGASRYSRAVVKESGFYELVLPLSYWNNGGSAFNPTRKIIVSFNAEYCRDLLRHRCGDPTSANIFKSANTLPGITAGTANGNITTGNTDSIFPLGGRMHEEFYMFHGAASRAIWNAPRIHMVKDLSYTPATFIKLTDAGLGYNDETFVIKNVEWSLSGTGKENLNLTLSLDESMRADNITAFLPSNAIYPATFHDNPPPVYVPPASPGVEELTTPPSYTFPPSGPGYAGGWGWGSGAIGADSNNISGNNLSTGFFARIRRRMDNFQHNMGFGETRILGAERTSTTPSTNQSIGATPVGDVSGGNALNGSNGMTFPGVGLTEDAGTPTFSSSFITTLTSLPNAMSDVLHIVADATNLSSNGGVAELSTVVTVNGATYTQTALIQPGTVNEQITLFNARVAGSNSPNTNIEVEISRNAGSGNDTANYASVSLNNLGIKQTTSAVSTTNTSADLSFSASQITQ